MASKLACTPAWNGALGRRAALRGAALGAITLMGCGGHGAHSAESHIRSTFGNGFCNLNFYYTNALQTAQADGLILDFVPTPTFAEQVTFLGAGQVDAGLMPYTSFVALYDAGAPVKVVAGGGIEGCVLVAQPGLDSPEKLKGKTLGTFQLDTLEVLPYDWMKKHGVDFKDITVRYMGNTPEAVEAFRSGALDMICTIEPYGTARLNDVKGSVKAQAMAEADPQKALDTLVGRYYKTSMANAQVAMGKQPSVVDARNQTQFILDRVESITAMGYIKKKPGRDAIDWTFLEQVIAENPDLYAKLKYKSA